MEGRAAPTRASRKRRAELLAEITEAILLARAAPGDLLTRAALATLGRASEPELAAVADALFETGLASPEGDRVRIRPLEPNAMLAALPRRRELELALVRGVVARASDAQLRAIEASEALHRRCAMIGDMDGMIHADRRFEELLAEASGLREEAEELSGLKVEFRRAWCAVNRLRDVGRFAGLRTALVAALVARDVAGAERQVAEFFDLLIASY